MSWGAPFMRTDYRTGKGAYFFVCIRCGAERSTSLYRKKSDGFCRDCRSVLTADEKKKWVQ